MKTSKSLRGVHVIRRAELAKTDDLPTDLGRLTGMVRPSPAEQVKQYITDAREAAANSRSEFPTLSAEIEVAATELERQFELRRHADLLAAAAIRLTELVKELEANSSRIMQAGLKTQLGGVKGAGRRWQDSDNLPLIEGARELLAAGISTRELTAACIERGLSDRSPRQTRSVLQQAGLVPRRKGS